MPGVILRYRNLGAGTARGRMYSAEAAAVNARADTAPAARECFSLRHVFLPGKPSLALYDLAATRVWNLT
jgi:hypothetical protein